MAQSQSYKNRTENIERRAKVVIKSRNTTIDLRILIDYAEVKKRTCTLVFDNLRWTVCDMMKEYFNKNRHWKEHNK